MKKVRLLLVSFLVLAACNESLYAGKIAPQAWLIAGPFFPGYSAGLLNASFLPEASLSPVAGETAGSLTWKEIMAKDAGIDFIKLGFAESRNSIIYAYTYIYSENNEAATLMLGSDDGISAWLNGENVWYLDRQRSVQQDEDKVPVQLCKGWNRLLLKISQFSGSWGFSCNLVCSPSARTSLSCPASELLVRLTKGQPEVRDISIANTDNHVKIIIAASIFHSGKSGENFVCTLEDSSGKVLASQRLRNCPPGKSSRVIFSSDAPSVASLLLTGGSQVRIANKNYSVPVKISSEKALEFLMLYSTDPARTDKETVVLASQLKSLMAMNRINPDLSVIANKGLQAIIEGRIGDLKKILHEGLGFCLAGVPDRSKDTIHVIGHAHMDMNWLWPWPESVKMIQDNLRQTVAFMDEYKDFTMLQSQAVIYKTIEETDTALFSRIREYVKEGRLEPVGGMWTEGDVNLSGGEALTRSFLIGQGYFQSRFGRIARVGWLPDDFGHISQFPQVLRLAGCKYFYFMRCSPYQGTFWWTGPDSSKVLCYSNDSYNGEISVGIRDEMDKVMPARHRMFKMFGVGDHGGGPTRKDIVMIHQLDSLPHFPAVKFTTAESFYTSAERDLKGLPVHRGEMQFTLEGCYTSIAGIKEGYRTSESMLLSAEFLSSLRWLQGRDYPATKLYNLWETLTFNQFHDILPGSAIYETYQDALADFANIRREALFMRDGALRAIADGIKMASLPGQPVVAFNFQPRKRKCLVEAEIYTADPPSTANLGGWFDYYLSRYVTPVDIGQGNVPSIMVRDGTGKSYPAQIIWGKNFPPGWRSRVLFVADEVPSGGYITYYIDTKHPGIANNPIAFADHTFETDFFRIAFDMKTGDIKALFDKRTGKEFATGKINMNQLRVYMEAASESNAWVIGHTVRVDTLAQASKVRITETGPVRACVEAFKKWGQSEIIQRTYIYQSYPRIDFELEVHWFERSTDSTNAPMLRAIFPLAMKPARFQCQVPFDVVNRPMNGQEVPAQQWVDISDSTCGIALLNRTKYGHSFENGELRLSLMRSTHNPDIYPNSGKYIIQYALFPHPGNWHNGVWSEGEDFNMPVLAIEPPSASFKSTATGPDNNSFISVEPSSIVLSGIKQSQEGKELVMRIAEVEGKGTLAEIDLPVQIKNARRLNLLEQELSDVPAPVVNGKHVKLNLHAHEIVTLGITF